MTFIYIVLSLFCFNYLVGIGSGYSGCKAYYKYGYGYDQMYSILGDEFEHYAFEKDTNDKIKFLEMFISVKSTKDGMILLSPVANPGPQSLVYEIGIGIASNQYTVLRERLNGNNEVVRVRTPDILNRAVYIRFIITISDGVLVLKTQDDNLPLLSYRDSRVNTVKYLGMSSWGNNKAKFRYSCTNYFGDCKRYMTEGYSYQNLLPLDDHPFEHYTLWKSVIGANAIASHFEMHMAIKGAKDALILLSPVTVPGPDDVVFEIGIGIAANQYTVVRTTINSGNEVVRVQTPGILSPYSYTNLYVKITNETLIFGKEGEGIPIIAYRDSRISNVKYFGMSSWGENAVTFHYDCY